MKLFSSLVLGALVLGSPLVVRGHGGGGTSMGGNAPPKMQDPLAVPGNAETLALFESLAEQLERAVPTELDRVWISAKEDFKLSPGGLAQCKDILKSLSDAIGLAGRPGENAKLVDARNRAADRIFKLRSGQDERSLRELDNWLMVSEGILRRAREDEEIAASKKAEVESVSKEKDKKRNRGGKKGH